MAGDGRVRAATAVRDLDAGDEAEWRTLWRGYCAFYGADVPGPVTDATWRRVLDPSSAVIGRAAVVGGRLAGFSISVLHPSTWTIEPSCYLEDLFVASDARGQGIGAALIEDLIARGRESGWSRLYWHTRAGNEAARGLYDRFGGADDFVRYRVAL